MDFIFSVHFLNSIVRAWIRASRQMFPITCHQTYPQVVWVNI
ncbi:hypothetical protein CSC28_6030 [Pseudomonas paraeruginosa]|nr:hypothetical protein CSC28_6030 [Pseudomonas paraeruginosa]